MITFVTLLLGLVVGVQPIEVAVSGPVAKVEIHLDGVKAGEVSAPPWRASVDLGAALEPHELVARALDAEGKPLASVAQWINLPRPKAEVEIVLENRPDGQPAAARLTWQSSDNSPPSAIALTLDDIPLVLGADRRASLPKLDLAESHILSAELRFGAGIVGRRDVVLGGSYGSQLATELTAVPLRVQGAARKGLAPAALQGRLAARGETLTVAAVEEGPAKVLVVSAVSPARVRERFFPAISSMAYQSQQRQIETFNGLGFRSSRTEMRLDEDTRVRFVAPAPRWIAGPSVTAEVFDTTRDFERKDGGMLFLLAGIPELAPNAPARRIADAVAVAGLLAAGENRRRAVVVVLSDQDEDASRFAAQQVKSYLAAMRVPIYVWNPLGDKAKAMAATWGGAEDVSSISKMRRALDKLKEDLASQRIIWVEGRHLPRAVELKPGDASVQPLVAGADAAANPAAGRRP